MRLGTLVLASALSLLAVCANAQPAAGVPKVGYLGFPGEAREASPMRDAFVRGLRDLGHVPGKTVILEVRHYATDEQLRQALDELIRLKPQVIFVGPPFGALAAKRMTSEIAIVCGSCGDPVENGLAASLARPGGNVTGLASLSAELIGKRIGLLKEALPGTSRMAVLVFPANPGTPATLKALDMASRDLGLEIRRFEIRGASDFDNALRSAAAAGVRAVVIQDDPLTRTVRVEVAELALKYRLAVSSGVTEVVEAGALMAYGPDRTDMVRRAAVFADKIFKGAKPADLPFEQAAKLELVLNLKTAKTLGVKIPQPFLLRANRVIE